MSEISFPKLLFLLNSEIEFAYTSLFKLSLFTSCTTTFTPTRTLHCATLVVETDVDVYLLLVLYRNFQLLSLIELDEHSRRPLQQMHQLLTLPYLALQLVLPLHLPYHHALLTCQVVLQNKVAGRLPFLPVSLLFKRIILLLLPQ